MTTNILGFTRLFTFLKRLVVSISFLLCGLPLEATIYHVKPQGSDTGNGLSWSQAFATLQQALEKAKDGDEIYLASGTYYPTSYQGLIAFEEDGPLTMRDYTFLITKNIAIYGGFKEDGTETVESRQPDTAPTILSGDLDYSSNLSDGDAYHVVMIAGSRGNTINPLLDGLTVRGGNADGKSFVRFGENSFSQSSGGGILSNFSNLTLRRVDITGNKAEVSGGGINNKGGSATLTNVKITGNAATLGGGIGNMHSPLLLTNVLIAGNKGRIGGGGIYNQLSSATLTNVTITGNQSDIDGAGIVNHFYIAEPTAATINLLKQEPTTLRIHNSILWGNHTSGDITTKDIYNAGAFCYFFHSLAEGSSTPGFWENNQNGGYMHGENNFDTDPLFVEYINPDASTWSPTHKGNYHLQEASPVIDKGSALYFQAGQTPDLSHIRTDIAGNPRISGSAPDMGAYEYVSTTPPQAIVDINSGVEPSFKVYVQAGAIRIEATKEAFISLYSFEGRLMIQRRISEGTTLLDSLSAGLYILRINGQEYKVVIR